MFHKNALVLGLSLLLVLSAPAKSFTKPGAGVSVRGGAASGATKSSLNSDSSSSSRRTAEALPEAGLTNKKKEEVATPARTARSLVQKRRSVIPFRSKSYIKSTQLDTKKLDKDIPSVRKVLLFAIPCIGVWMYMPLLSMMDTSAVGKFAGTAQQAALNPAIAIINYGTRLLSFLYTGTTTLVAAANESDKGRPNKPKTRKTLTGALQLSLYVGIGLGGLIFVFARQFLYAIMGNADAAILEPAMDYLRIRALAMPAVAVLGSAQTACLGLKDLTSPVYATVLAAVVNYFANMFLVRQFGGAAGAAWATVLAQYVSVVASVWWFLYPRRKKPANGEFTTRGFLSDQLKLRDVFRPPANESTKGFAPYLIPCTTTQAGRCSASASLDHVVSSSLGTVSMAANQIITSVFYGLVPFADSLSLAAQSFLPAIQEMQSGPEKAYALGKIRMSFFKAAMLCGATLAAVMAWMPVGCKLFTSDPAVIQMIRAVVPIHFVLSWLHGIFCASEGFLLGQKDLGFLGKMYTVFTFLIPWMMLQVKKAAVEGSPRGSLSSVWLVFLAYQVARTGLMAGRVVWLQLKAKVQTPVEATN